MKNGKIVFTIKELLYSTTAILLFLQIYLQNYIGILQYFDEMVAVVCLLKIVYVGIIGKMEKNHVNMLLLMVLTAVIGLISNFVFELQLRPAPLLTDIGNTFKVFIVYIGASLFLKTERHKERIVNSLFPVIRLFVVITFVCMVLHEIGIVTMGDDVRMGLISFRFINTGAGVLSMMFYTVMLIQTLNMALNGAKRKNIILVLMALAVWVSTLRARAAAFVLVYLVIYWLVIIRGQKLKLNIQNGIIVLMITAFICMDQIEYYFTSSTVARAQLFRYGVTTMLRYFPLGSGFATFGTDAAYKYYSVLYQEYGFNSIWGLSQQYGFFSHDTYWPAIFAQFGLFGAICMAGTVFIMCKDILKKTKHNKFCFLAGMFTVFTQVLSSAATATFFHYVTAGLFFVVPLLFGTGFQKKEGIGQQWRAS